MPSEEGQGATSNVKKKKKPVKPKKKEIKTENDLWSMPDEDEPKDDEPEIDIETPEKDNPEEDNEGDNDDSQEEGAEGPDDGWGDVGDHDQKGEQEGYKKDSVNSKKSGDSIKLVPLVKKKNGKEATKTPKDKKAKVDSDDNSGDKNKVVPSKDEDKEAPLPDMAAEGSIIPVSGSRADLDRLWEQRRLHLDQRDFALARQDFEKFMSLRKELALENLYPQAWVLIHNAKDAAKRADTKQAERLINAAVELAPDLPDAYLARASMNFSKSPFGLGIIWDDVYMAAKTALRNPLIANRLLLNLIFSVLLGLALAIVLFTLVELLKNIRLFIHDFHHLFPRGVAHFQTAILAVLLLILPLLLRLGLLVVILLWLAVGWIYQDWRARSLTLLSVLLIAGLPLAMQFSTSRMLMTQGIFSDALDVSTGPAHTESLNTLRASLLEHEDDKLILAVLASYSKRTGKLAEAKELYSKALAVEPDSVVLLNNLGNVLFLTGDLRGAVQKYIRATKVRPDMVEPYFNLSRAYFRSADLDKGKESINQAIHLNNERVRQLRKLAEIKVDPDGDGTSDPSTTKASLANYAVADLSIPVDWFYGVEKISSFEQVFSSIMFAATGFSSAMTVWIICGTALLVFFLLLALRKHVFSSNACIRCGKPACRLCSPELRDDSVCGQCFHVFVKKSQVDARSRISKEIQVRKYRRRKATIATGINFLLPGLGQMIKGRILRGALVLLLFSLVLMQVLVGGYFVRDTLSLGPWRNWLLLGPQLVLFALFYVWSVIDSFRDES